MRSQNYIENLSTRDEIFELALNVPIVRAAIEAWKAGMFKSWEECLICCIKQLVRENEYYREQLIKKLEHLGPTIIVENQI